MRLVRPGFVSGMSILLLALARPALAQTPDGAEIYQRECASCHAQPAADSRAPSRETLRQFIPEAIIGALTNGPMRIQGEKLSEADRRAVAGFLADRSTPSAVTTITTGRCTSSPPMSDPAKG